MTTVERPGTGRVAGRRKARLLTLEDRWDSRANGVGLLRLVLASAVLVSHSWPLGFGAADLGHHLSHGQTNLGSLAVLGFFVLSGFLVSSGAQRLSTGRFLWHRFLRIFPGLWVCLLVIALVIGPLAAWFEGSTAAAYWTHPRGPLSFLANGWSGTVRQQVISTIFADTPYGKVQGGPSAVAGSLWTLRYEIACYALLAVLGAIGVMRRRRLVATLTVAVGLVLLVKVVRGSGVLRAFGVTPQFPVIGSYSYRYLLLFTFMFLLGACARLFKHRLPINAALAVLAGAGLVLSALLGGFFVIGLPCFAYLLVHAAACLPARTHAIGRKHDYSYGIYIYAFVVQQMLALLGGASLGLPLYIVASFVGAVVLAAASWRWVEEPAMRWKNWTPGWLASSSRRRARLPEPS